MDDELALFGDADEEAAIARFAASDWRGCAIKRGARGPVSPLLARDAHPEFAPAPEVVEYDRGRRQLQRRLPGGVPFAAKTRRDASWPVTMSLPAWSARRAR